MRILALLFIPAQALIYFAGTQYPSWLGIGAAAWACLLMTFVIGRIYAAALNEPHHFAEYFSSRLNGQALHNFTDFDADDVPVYVATQESGIVLAHNVYTARYDGLPCVIIIESEKRTHGEDS